MVDRNCNYNFCILIRFFISLEARRQSVKRVHSFIESIKLFDSMEGLIHKLDIIFHPVFSLLVLLFCVSVWDLVHLPVALNHQPSSVN